MKKKIDKLKKDAKKGINKIKKEGKKIKKELNKAIKDINDFKLDIDMPDFKNQLKDSEFKFNTRCEI